MPIEKVTGVRIPPRILEQVERFGESEGITRSQAIIKLIERGLGSGGDSATVRERLERLEKNDLELFNELNNVKNRLTNLNTAAAAQPAAPTTTPPATDRPTAAAAAPHPNQPAPTAAAADTGIPVSDLAPPPAPTAAAAAPPPAPTTKPAGKGMTQPEALEAANCPGSPKQPKRWLPEGMKSATDWLHSQGWRSEGEKNKRKWYPPGG